MISVFYCSLRKKNWFQEPLQLETGLLLVDKIFHGCYASCGLIAIMCKCALHSYKLGDLYINKYIYILWLGNSKTLLVLNIYQFICA